VLVEDREAERTDFAFVADLAVGLVTLLALPKESVLWEPGVAGPPEVRERRVGGIVVVGLGRSEIGI